MANINTHDSIQQLYDTIFDIEQSVKQGQNKYIQIKHGAIASTADSTAKPAIGSASDILQYYRNETRMLSDAIDSGYSKLPKYVGKVYRGDLLSDEEMTRMESGEYFDEAFLSFSTDLEVSEEFCLRKPTNEYEKHPVIIEVLSKNGRETSILSDRPQEKEVTFKKGQRFKVVSKKEIEMRTPKKEVRKVLHFVLTET